MAILLALASAAFYGSADFLGGLASRRISTIAVVFLSQLAGIVLLLSLIPVLPPARAGGADLAWGAAAGLAGGLGVALLYRALAIGRMAVVAPITAVCSVALPVLARAVAGERPGRLTAAGILLAVVAIVLVSQDAPRGGTASARASSGAGLGLALLAGVAIGLFYLALAETAAGAGLLPLVAARAVSVPLFGMWLLLSRHVLRIRGSVVAIVVMAGVLDMLANALYLLATRRGALAVVVTLASLYPASTVLLARLVLRERLNRLQVAGVVCALAAVALIVG